VGISARGWSCGGTSLPPAAQIIHAEYRRLFAGAAFDFGRELVRFDVDGPGVGEK
jgi:hypothetical protein